MRLFKQKKLVKIVPNQDFLDGTDRYIKGKSYKVDLGKAKYFDRNAWLEGSEPATPPINPSLDIHDSHLNHQGGVNG